jgi:hypothetical protein
MTEVLRSIDTAHGFESNPQSDEAVLTDAVLLERISARTEALLGIRLEISDALYRALEQKIEFEKSLLQDAARVSKVRSERKRRAETALKPEFFTLKRLDVHDLI